MGPLPNRRILRLYLELTDERDKLAAHIEIIERGIRDYPESARDMMTVARLVAMLDPQKERLASIEQSISHIQAAMEAPDAQLTDFLIQQALGRRDKNNES